MEAEQKPVLTAEEELDQSPPTRALWEHVSKLAKQLAAESNPWRKHDLASLPVQSIVHHLFDPRTSTWSSVEGLCKMQTEPFDEGAMRQCYRMICTEAFGEPDHKVHALNWQKAANYVAKRYKPVRRSKLPEIAALRKAVETADGTHTRLLASAEERGGSFQFHVGQTVLANYQGSGSWYEAVVVSVTSVSDGAAEGERYTVEYVEDGECEDNLSAASLRLTDHGADLVDQARTATAGNSSSTAGEDPLVSPDPSVYFSDVLLQMRSSAWAYRFNRTNPPKKIHFILAHIMEVRSVETLASLPPPPPRPSMADPMRSMCSADDIEPCAVVNLPSLGENSGTLYAVERFISGQYTKHNSNSGFVDENHRMTPQAFSHFTFVQSALCSACGVSGTEMVVDIQGVGDLWTDPQLHSMDGRYGSGDLQARGMAFFFATHQCNGICEGILHLDPFPLAPSQQLRVRQPGSLPNYMPTSPKLNRDPTQPIAARKGMHKVSTLPGELHRSMTTNMGLARIESAGEDEGVDSVEPGVAWERRLCLNLNGGVFKDNIDSGSIAATPASASAHTTTNNDDNNVLQEANGAVHLEMSKLHAVGTFSGGDVDSAACLFHLHAAARLGNTQAQWSLAGTAFGFVSLGCLFHGAACLLAGVSMALISRKRDHLDKCCDGTGLYMGVHDDLLPDVTSKPLYPETAPPPMIVEEDGPKACMLLEYVAANKTDPVLALTAAVRLSINLAHGLPGLDADAPKAMKAADTAIALHAGLPVKDSERLELSHPWHKFLAHAAQLAASQGHEQQARRWYEQAGEEAMEASAFAAAARYQELAQEEQS